MTAAKCRANPIRHHRTRRGLAMMLVVIALAVGTVITGVALSSRSLAPELGENAESAASAKWSAESAAQYAVAALQTNLDLDTLTDGAMLSNFALAGGSVDVVVTDLEGNPPTDEDREVVVTVSASVDGIPAVTRRIVALKPTPYQAPEVDPYLSEFTLFANEGLTVHKEAKVGKWELSPEGKSVKPPKIGAGFSSLASVNIDPESGIDGAALFVDASASLSLEMILSDRRLSEAAKLPIDIPARHASVPAAVSALRLGGTTSFTYDQKETTTVFPHNREYAGTLTVYDGATLVLDEAVSPAYAFSGLVVNKDACLIIRGDVDVEINGSMYVMDESLIHVEPGGRLDLFVRGNVVFNKGAIGVGPEAIDEIGGDPRKLSQYARPDTVRILSPTGSYPNQNFTMDSKALVVASVHMPATSFRIKESTLIGRVTAKAINIDDKAVVLADSRLDNQKGYTNLDSSMYNEDGTLCSDVFDLLSGVLAVLHAGKSAEEIAAIINTRLSASVEAAPAPTPGTTARTARSTTVISVPIASKVIEGKAVIVTESDEAQKLRVLAATPTEDEAVFTPR